MRPVLRRAVLAAACCSALVLSGCGKHVAANAPITFAPADTPYLFANFKSAPRQTMQAWIPTSQSQLTARIGDFASMATRISPEDPHLAAVLNAIHTELANVHTLDELTKATGFSWPTLYAVYAIGDVPVMRVELASADAFKAFWARVEKRAGIPTPSVKLGQQNYWVIGGDHAKARLLVAVEGEQVMATLAPANASTTMLKSLLGLTKPANSAADKLTRIDSQNGYGDYGSGYVDLPKLFANLFDGKHAMTQAFAKSLGIDVIATNSACVSEFASLSSQVPLISGGIRTYTEQEISGSFDLQLSPALLGALTALKQPVPGMDETSDTSVFDLVLALPVQKWQAFLKGRAKAAAEKTYQCPALQSLNDFAKTAAHPPALLPPEATSLLGLRAGLDTWDIGPKIAGRMLVASSNPAELARMIQQTLPQFALKTIPTDGKPVAFDLPPTLQASLGAGNQGWVAANTKALAVGIGDGEEAKLADTLSAPAGNGDKLLRLHFDGKMYQLLGNWMGRFAAMMPAANQTQMQRQVAVFNDMGKVVQSEDVDVKLDDKGLHFEAETKHR